MALSLDQTPEGWNAVVEEYERVLEPLTTQFAEEALRLTAVKPRERILDVAAGSGSLTLCAARAGADVVAIDFSPQMVRRLRVRIEKENLVNTTVEVMDGQALDFGAGLFDAAFSILGLMFFPDRDKGFGEIFRVLKPGGRAAIVAWAGGGFRISRFLTRVIESAVPEFPPLAPPTGTQLQDVKTFASEMKNARFKQVAVHTLARTWKLPSAEWLWEHARGYSPAVAAIFEKLDHFGPDLVDRTRKVFLDTLQREFGNGPLRLEREVHICTGVK